MNDVNSFMEAGINYILNNCKDADTKIRSMDKLK